MLIDISPPLGTSLAVWPGDTPLSRKVLLDLARGDSVTLSTLAATVHLGAHADAPSHYGAGAPDIASRDLGLYLGPCRVMRVNVKRGGCVTPEMLPQPPDAPRVLLATGTYPDPDRFTQDFAGLSPELVDHLHAEGVRLIGIDTPSVDPFASKDLPSHRRFLATTWQFSRDWCWVASRTGCTS